MLALRILSFIVIFFGFVSGALAASIIELSEHTISYQSGMIDEETLNGDAKNVVIRQKSRRGGSVLIDQYKMISTVDNDVTKIEDLSLSGITIIAEDKSKITVEELSWRDGEVDRNWIDVIINGVGDENAIMSNLGVITANNIAGSENGQTMFTVDSIFFNSAEMQNNPYENLPISDLSFEFRNIYIPSEVSGDDEFVLGMQAMGLDGVRMSVALAAKNVLLEDRINTNMTLFLSADKMADIRMSMAIGTSDLILSEVNRMVEVADMEDVADMYIELMMVGMFFNNMDLIIADKGIRNVIMDDFAYENNVTRDQAVTLMMDSVAASIGVAAPNTYAEIDPHLRGFLAEGGTLYLGLNPTQPVPAASLFGIIAIPDQAKDLLGLSIQHQQ